MTTRRLATPTYDWKPVPDGQGVRVRDRAPRRRHRDARHRQRRPLAAVDRARRRPRGHGQRGAPRRPGDLRAERLAARQPPRARPQGVDRAAPGPDLREAPTPRRSPRGTPRSSACRSSRSATRSAPDPASASPCSRPAGTARRGRSTRSSTTTPSPTRSSARPRARIAGRAARSSPASTCRTPLPACGSTAGTTVPTLRCTPRTSPPQEAHRDPELDRSTSSPDDYVERFAALDPLGATGEGITGHDHEMTDYSPDGIDERAEHDRATLRALGRSRSHHRRRPHRRRSDARAARARARGARRRRAAARPARARQPGAGRADGLRPDAPRTPPTHWQTIAERLALVPQGLSSIEAALTEGVQQGIVAARRQAVACAQQADVWGGVDGSSRRRSSSRCSTSTTRRASTTAPSATGWRRLATRATAAYASLGRYLVEEYAPHAAEHDPVGRERYSLYARDFNGIELDLDETYAWGWDELHRIEHAMGAGRGAHHPGRRRRRGDRAPRNRPAPRDRGRRRVPALEPGPARHAPSPSSTARTSTSPNPCSGSRR